MSDIFFEEMDIPKPDYNLGIGGGSHGNMTGRMIEEIEKILINEQPDWILVYGDTNSTLAGAIAASKLHIKIAHIEAGLRSFNMNMPEEINRILTDRISTILFCPTSTAMDNLNVEGVADWKAGKALLSGDVMKDAADFYRQFSKPVIEFANKKFVLCTIHRAENTDNEERLSEIMQAIAKVAKDTIVVLPLHPRTKKLLSSAQINTANIKVIDPVGYFNMVWLLENCKLVMTDSGGLQKEAFFFKKPCITLRDETEWVELIDNGFNVLAGANKQKILDSYRDFDFSDNYDRNLYGNGSASNMIVSELLNAK